MKTILMVFGREDARRDWLDEQAQPGARVHRGEGTVTTGETVTLARTVRDTDAYRALRGAEIHDVKYHASFKRAPDNWYTFIASRIRPYFPS